MDRRLLSELFESVVLVIDLILLLSVDGIYFASVLYKLRLTQ